MIIGIGTDICDIRRIEKILKNKGEQFITRVFSDEERVLAEKRSDIGQGIATYAKRYAAKEACSKALGLGIDAGVYLKDIEVQNNSHGAPILKLHGGALTQLQNITPDDMRAILHLSLSDEPPYALAYVVIDAIPASP